MSGSNEVTDNEASIEQASQSEQTRFTFDLCDTKLIWYFIKCSIKKALNKKDVTYRL